MEHVREKYGIQLTTCTGLDSPEITQESFDKLEEYCNSLNDFQIVALETAVSTAKSASIGLSLVDGFITVDDAVYCSRIEENLQIEEFGKVEGAHDIDELHTEMDLAASMLLFKLTKDPI